MKKLLAALTTVFMLASVSFAYGYTPQLISKKNIKNGVVIKRLSPAKEVKKAVKQGKIPRIAKSEEMPEPENNNLPNEFVQDVEVENATRLLPDQESGPTPRGNLNIWSCELENDDLENGFLTDLGNGFFSINTSASNQNTHILNTGCWQTCLWLDQGENIEVSNIHATINGDADSIRHKLITEENDSPYPHDEVRTTENQILENNACQTYRLYSKFNANAVDEDEISFSATFHAENNFLGGGNCSPEGQNNCESNNYLLNNPALFNLSPVYFHNLPNAEVPFSRLNPANHTIGEWNVESIDLSHGDFSGEIVCKDEQNNRVNVDAELTMISYDKDGSALEERNFNMRNGFTFFNFNIEADTNVEISLVSEDADEDISSFSCGFNEETSVVKTDNRYGDIDLEDNNWNIVVPESLDVGVACHWGIRPPRVLEHIDSFMWQGDVDRGIDDNGNEVFASIYDTNIVNMACFTNGEDEDEAILTLNNLSWSMDSYNFEEDYDFDLLLITNGDNVVYRETITVDADNPGEQIINIVPDVEVSFAQHEGLVIALRPNENMNDLPRINSNNVYTQVERPTIAVNLLDLQISDNLGELADVTLNTVVDRGRFREFTQLDLSEVNQSQPTEVAFANPYFAVEADEMAIAMVNQNSAQGQNVWSGELKNLYTGGIMQSIKFRHNTGKAHLGQTRVDVNINGQTYRALAGDWDAEYFEIEFPEWNKPFIDNGNAIGMDDWVGAANITPIDVTFSRSWQGMNPNFRVELVGIEIESGVKQVPAEVGRFTNNMDFIFLDELRGVLGTFIAIMAN